MNKGLNMFLFPLEFVFLLFTEGDLHKILCELPYQLAMKLSDIYQHSRFQEP